MFSNSILRLSAACVGIALFATPAASQISNLTLSADGQVSVYGELSPGFPALTLSAGPVTGTNLALEGGYYTYGSAGVFSATSAIDSDFIHFRNGNSAGGTHAAAYSHTLLQFDLTNDTGSTLTPTLSSTILPAGMGWFVGNQTCLDAINACDPTEDVFGGAVTLQSFLPKALAPNVMFLGGGEFDFKVSAGADMLYDINGSFDLLRGFNPDSGLVENYLVTSLAQAELDLLNFRVTSDNPYSWGVQWDATNIPIDFISPLDPLETVTLKYETMVSTYSYAECLDDACLFTYASFGDPIGRGGGVTAMRAMDFSAFATPQLFRYINPPEEEPLAFPETLLQLPTFKDGVVYLRVVPEPSTWLMMIGGFALLGRRAAQAERESRIEWLKAIQHCRLIGRRDIDIAPSSAIAIATRTSCSGCTRFWKASASRPNSSGRQRLWAWSPSA